MSRIGLLRFNAIAFQVTVFCILIFVGSKVQLFATSYTFLTFLNFHTVRLCQ